MKWRWIFAVMSILVSVLCLIPRLGEAAGPWKAQIVDAETGKPLEEVVVLAVWRHCGFIYMDGCGYYYDSEEVVTGADGRFVIEARWSLFRTIKGPDFTIFKPGYGRWRLKGEDVWLKLDTYERNKRFDEAWEQFRGDGVVIELPPLKTREERLKFYQSPGRTPPGIVPGERMRRFQEAENAERAYLGFRN